MVDIKSEKLIINMSILKLFGYYGYFGLVKKCKLILKRIKLIKKCGVMVFFFF